MGFKSFWVGWWFFVCVVFFFCCVWFGFFMDKRKISLLSLYSLFSFFVSWDHSGVGSMVDLSLRL